MMGSALLSCAQILVIGLGLCVAAGLDLRALGLRAPAIAWTVGAFAVSAVVLVCGLFGWFPAARVVVGASSVVLVALMACRTAWRGRLPRLVVDRVHAIPAIIALVVGAWLVTGWMYVSDYPLRGDESGIWNARAVVAKDAGGFGSEYQAALDPDAQRIGHPDYPPLNSLLQLWTSLCADEDPGTHVRLPILVFDLVSLLFLVGMLTMRTCGWLGLLIAAGPFLTTWYGSPTASSDRLVALGLLMAMDRRAFPFGVALMVCAKHEGTALALVLAVALAVVAICARPREGWSPRRILSGYLVGGGLLTGIWGWNVAYGLTNDVADGGLFARLLEEGPGRAGTLAEMAWSDFITAPGASALLLPLAVFFSVMRPTALRRPDVMLPALVSLGGTVALLLVFLATPHGLLWHWDTAGPRVLSQVSLVTALWAATLAAGERA